MTRVLTAALLIPAVTYVALWGHWVLFYACVIAVAVLCHREYEALAAAHGMAAFGIYGLAAGVVLLFVPRSELILFVIFALLAMALAMRADPLSGALPRAAG